MNEICLKKTRESVRSCNCCFARNYDSSLSLLGEKVDLLFELTMGSQQVCLCESCLNRLHNVVERRMIMLNGAKATKELLNALDNEKKPQTNADRIRAMNDYELSVFLTKTKAKLDRLDLLVIAYSTQDIAENLEWLMQPVKEGDNERT